jgi:hypothetical protein
MQQLLKAIFSIYVLSVAGGIVARGETIDFEGSFTASVSVDSVGRCAPFLTFNAAGGGVGTLLGDFISVQSDCRTSDSSFDEGVFEFRSVAVPEDSLFGTYFTVAAPQDGMLELTSILLVNGGTGRLGNTFGAIFGFGTLDEESLTISESISGQLETAAPEPGMTALVAAAIGALWLWNRKRGPVPGVKVCYMRCNGSSADGNLAGS